MTLFDEIIALLDLVGSRECIHCYIDSGCTDEACEPCRARELFARMVEARDRVA